MDMEKQKNYKKTLITCYIGFITQAIVANSAPLLFLRFHGEFGIPLGQIALISTVFYIVQILVDVFCAKFVDRIGYRKSVVASQLMAAAGLVALGILPDAMQNPLVGILISVTVYAVGSGLIEVLVSPIVEACPFDNKDSVMSLLHSFYCWGHVGVILLSTLFFCTIGLENWKVLTLLWALIPAGNAVLFLRAPIGELVSAEEQGMTLRELLTDTRFILLFFMMFWSGSSEQGLVQWASVFAEQTLGVPKAIGDLAGPMAFAVCMGSARAFYAGRGKNIDLNRFIRMSSVLCLCSYLLTALAPLPALSLLGCALCGLSVGILWPGTYSKAAKTLRTGGTAMFALLAVAGDLGCAAGPVAVGLVSELCGGNLKTGIFAGAVFPALLLVCLRLERKNKESSRI